MQKYTVIEFVPAGDTRTWYRVINMESKFEVCRCLNYDNAFRINFLLNQQEQKP